MMEPTLLDRFEVVLSLMEAMQREGIPFDQALRILRSGFGMDRTSDLIAAPTKRDR